MTPTEEKLQISEFNNKVLRDDYKRIKKELEKSRKELEAMTFNYDELGNEYRELRKKYDELNGYYGDLNDRYVNKLNAYNATVVKMRDIEKENNKLTKVNKEVSRDFYIMFALLIVSLAFYFIG